MNKLVIDTQYKENYAYPEWDGKGEVPDGWKFKGGATYVIPRFKDFNNAGNIVTSLEKLICYSNPASEEYILTWNIVEQAEKVCESWETPTNLWLNSTGQWEAIKITDNRPDEDGYGGYMRSEILEKTETWTLLPNGERTNFKVEYLMQDGDEVIGDKGLKEWFNSQEAA